RDEGRHSQHLDGVPSGPDEPPSPSCRSRTVLGEPRHGKANLRLLRTEVIMSDQQQEWFIEERTRALAMIHLTRREDLAVANADRGSGLQLVVSITKGKGEPSLRQFGVFLRGTKPPTTEADLDRTLRPTVRELLRAGEYPYPACLFHFSMDDDQ